MFTSKTHPGQEAKKEQKIERGDTPQVSDASDQAIGGSIRNMVKR